MQFIKYLFLILLCISCTSKPKKIDKNSIDLYPIFSECDSVSNYKLSKRCFQKVTSQKIKAHIDSITFEKKIKSNHHLKLHVKVLKNGKIVLDSLQNNAPFLNESIDLGLDLLFSNFYAEQASQKQGIPVDCTFIIPILLKRR